ncbi:MAG: tyrosine-type recombinase/integrase, partial [Deltaproteobacteria bacterium]|nr:tyrosine-type recombinase/integrase [Deltaproteobacteria bacterium]
MKRNGKNTAHPGIRKTGRKSYHVRATAKCPRTGKRHEKERRLDDVNLADAITAQADLKRRLVDWLEHDDPNKVTPVKVHNRTSEDMTLIEYAKLWFVHIDQSGRKRPHVVDIDIRRAEVHILPLLGQIHISDIGKPELSSWMDKVTQQRKANGEPYAKETLKSAWRLLSSMLRDAELLVGIPNYSPNNMRFRVKAPTTRAKDTLTRDELAALLAMTTEETPDIRAMLWVQATTGMRFGEVSALNWDDIDLDKGLIHVRRSQVEGKVFPTKTSTSRTVPLFPIVADILREHRLWLSSRGYRLGLHKDEVVFPSKAGTYRSST